MQEVLAGWLVPAEPSLVHVGLPLEQCELDTMAVSVWLHRVVDRGVLWTLFDLVGGKEVDPVDLEFELGSVKMVTNALPGQVQCKAVI